MSDQEYFDAIEAILDDPRCIAIFDMPDHEGEIVIHTGIMVNDGEWSLNESATGN